jgi:acetoacetyl-CoA reductase
MCVNAVTPGCCDTDMMATVPPDVPASIAAGIPAGRLGTPEEIARMVSFFVSDDAGFINGATFSINGGQCMA